MSSRNETVDLGHALPVGRHAERHHVDEVVEVVDPALAEWSAASTAIGWKWNVLTKRAF